MKRLAWLTDIHLNDLDGNVIGDGVSDRWRDIDRFLDSAKATNADAVLISGDIGEAPFLMEYLPRIAGIVGRPIYFALGNHDFYHGSIAGVRSAMKDLGDVHKELVYLGGCDAIELTPNFGLLGENSWADGQYGQWLPFYSYKAMGGCASRHHGNSRTDGKKALRRTE